MPLTNGLHHDYGENINTGETTERARRAACASRHARMTTARPAHATLRLLAATVVGGLALLAAGAPTASSATSASLQSTNKCWLAVINDWLADNRVDKTYAVPCYTQAIQHLSQFPDVRGYSSAEDDIHNALLAAIRQDRGGGSGGGGGGGPGGPSGPGSSPSGPNDGTTSPSNSHKSFTQWLGDRLGPGNAQSVPLPLLVLGGLALLLLLTAGGTWIARRIQARRMTAAPAPVRRP